MMRKSVDGFRPNTSGVLPVTKITPKCRLDSYRNIASNPHVGRSIDGIRVIRKTAPVQHVEMAWEKRPRVGFDTPEFIKDPTLEGKPHTRSSLTRKILALLQYPLIAIVAIGGAMSTDIGQWFILTYALYVLIGRKDSRNTFILALIFLVAIPVFQILKQPGVSENIAVYTYELLVVGALQAILELALSNKKSHNEAIRG